MANRSQLDTLLKKKGWTGKEVGQILIASMLNDIKQQGKEDKKPLFTQAEFEQIESTLASEKDYIAYNVYESLHSSIIDSFNRGQGLYQQFYNGFNRLFLELVEAQSADHAQKALDKTPLIMTESQYKRLEAKTQERLSKTKSSFSSLMFHCLDSFLRLEETYTKVEAPAVWRELEATKKKPATGNRFLPLYNETFGEGYYQLPDGRRSDQLTAEQWEKALQELFLETHQLTIDGEPASLEETKQHFRQASIIKGYELFFRGGEAIREEIQKRTGKPTDLTDEELEKALEYVIQGKGGEPLDEAEEHIAEVLDNIEPTEWHTYEEPPEDLALYDLLDMYPMEHRGEIGKDGKEALKHLKADAPALYDALKAYIESKVPQARGLKANQLHKDIISWGELEQTGLIGCKELTDIADSLIAETATDGEDTTESQSKRLRAKLNGIAILKNPTRSQTDERGDYKEPESPLSYFDSLYDLEHDGEQIAEIQRQREELVYPALGYLYAFNALMEIIGGVYDLPELAEVAHFDTKHFESKMSGYNGLLFSFYHEVYGNEAEKQRKRAIIKKIFSPLEAEPLKPTQEAIEAVTATLKKLGLKKEARVKLLYLDAFIDHLMSGEGV